MGEDISILEEAWNDEDGSLGSGSEDDLTDRMKDPDWNANMEDEETDSSDDDELDEEEVRENTSQDVRYIDLCDNPLDCTKPLRAEVNISSDCLHSTVKPTAAATTLFIQRKSTRVPSPAAPRTSQVKTVTASCANVSTPSPANALTPSPSRTGENHTLLVLSVLLPACAVAFVIACFYAIRRRRRRRPSVYDKLFVLNNVCGHFSIDSLSSDSLDDEINYLQDSAF
jgi:hypothetical protein